MILELTAPLGALGLSSTSTLPPGTTIEFQQRASMFEDGGPRLVISGPEIEETAAMIRENQAIETLSLVDGTTVDKQYDLTWNETGSSLLEALNTIEGTVVRATAEADCWTFELRFDDYGAVDRFVTAFDTSDCQLSLDYDSATDDGERTAGALTPREHSVLAKALVSGYFAVPRQVTLVEVAEALDTGDVAASEQLRTGTAKVLGHHLADADSRPTISEPETN